MVCAIAGALKAVVQKDQTVYYKHQKKAHDCKTDLPPKVQVKVDAVQKEALEIKSATIKSNFFRGSYHHAACPHGTNLDDLYTAGFQFNSLIPKDAQTFGPAEDPVF